MALFGKKVSPFDKLLEDYNNLPEEDKAKFKASIEDVEKAEDEREIDKVEEEKAEAPEKADEKAEEVKEESEEIGEDIDKAEEEAHEEEQPAEEEEAEEEHESEEDKEAEEEAEEDVEDATDAKMEAFFEEWEIYKGKVDKLYERLEETEKPAETVGLGKQKNVEAGEDEEDLSAYDYAMKHAKY